MTPPYTEISGKVIEKHPHFKHVMAISLDKRTNHLEGVIRCITSREGNVDIAGYIDRSILHKVKGDSLERFEIGEPLKINNEKEIIESITEPGYECIGLEDPDIWVDEEACVMHLYFTIPLINREKSMSKIYLGYAVGPDLDNLEMTLPVLGHEEEGVTWVAKEVSMAPVNKKGMRLNLIESDEAGPEFGYSVVRVAVAPPTRDSTRRLQKASERVLFVFDKCMMILWLNVCIA